MKIINIGKDFSRVPSGRYVSDSKSSGEKFREDVLKPCLRTLSENEKVKIILDDGVEGYGSSFLVEAFAGAVRDGTITAFDLLSKLELTYSDEDYEFYADRIRQYVSEAKSS